MMKKGSIFSTQFMSKLAETILALPSFREALAKSGNSHAVGDVKESMLTESQFQEVMGNTWVLMDGRDVSGSDYASITGNTTLSDARGIFRRAKNNGRSDGQEDPDGERNLGDFEGDAIRNITGTVGFRGYPGEQYRSNSFHSGVMQWGGSTSASDPGINTTHSNEIANRGHQANRTNFNASLVVPTAGDNRPKNITVNVFIKINW
jgi:hypothetical protein